MPGAALPTCCVPACAACRGRSGWRLARIRSGFGLQPLLVLVIQAEQLLYRIGLATRCLGEGSPGDLGRRLSRRSSVARHPRGVIGDDSATGSERRKSSGIRSTKAGSMCILCMHDAKYILSLTSSIALLYATGTPNTGCIEPLTSIRPSLTISNLIGVPSTRTKV